MIKWLPGATEFAEREGSRAEGSSRLIGGRARLRTEMRSVQNVPEVFGGGSTADLGERLARESLRPEK